MTERSVFSTNKEAHRAAKDYADMLYREDICIRDTVNCPTKARSWPAPRGSNHLWDGEEWHAVVEYYKPSAETGRPQFHRQVLTPADVERLNEYLKARLDQMRESRA